MYTFSFKRIELNDPKVKILDSKGVIAISKKLESLKCRLANIVIIKQKYQISSGYVHFMQKRNKLGILGIWVNNIGDSDGT
jgi:hypothetical protein